MGQPKEKRENKWINRGLKQGAGRANLRKKRKQMDEQGLKKGGWAGLMRKRMDQ